MTLKEALSEYADFKAFKGIDPGSTVPDAMQRLRTFEQAGLDLAQRIEPKTATAGFIKFDYDMTTDTIVVFGKSITLEDLIAWSNT